MIYQLNISKVLTMLRSNVIKCDTLACRICLSRHTCFLLWPWSSICGEVLLFPTEKLSLLEFPRVLKEVKIKKRKFLDNYWQNICRLFHDNALFPVTTRKLELDYYQQKVNVKVASRLTEWLRTYDLRQLENFKKIPGKLRIDGKSPSSYPKAEFGQLC